MIVRWWSQSNELVAQLNENDRLKHLVALQYEILRGRLSKNDVAVKLAEKGDIDRAAIFAAEALLESSDLENRSELEKLVKDYAERKHFEADESENAMLQRIVEEAESRQSGLLAADKTEDDEAGDGKSNNSSPKQDVKSSSP